MIATVLKGAVRESRVRKNDPFLALKVEIDNEIAYIYISPKLEYAFKALCRWCDVDYNKIITGKEFENKLFPVKYPPELEYFAGRNFRRFHIDYDYVR